MARTLYLNNDYDVLLRDATTVSTGAAITSATVTWELLTAAGVSLGTGSLAYASGQFAGVIEADVFEEQAVDDVLTLKITLAAAGVDAEWTDRRCTVKERPFEV